MTLGDDEDTLPDTPSQLRRRPPLADPLTAALLDEPGGYEKLLRIHHGDLARTAWVVASTRLLVAGSSAPPSPADVHAAAATVALHQPETILVPNEHDLARECRAQGLVIQRRR